MMIANPLIASPIYNRDGDMTFKYNRIKALHIGWSGQITSEWSYIAKMSHNRTWGTPGAPTLDILENFFGLCLVSLILPKDGKAGTSTPLSLWIWEIYTETTSDFK